MGKDQKATGWYGRCSAERLMISEVSGTERQSDAYLPH